MKPSRFLISILMFSLSTEILSCADYPPGKAPTLKHKIMPFFRNAQSSSHGTAKTLLNLDKTGNVTQLTIINIEPKNIEKEPIEKAIQRASFHMPKTQEGAVEDFIFIFEFDVTLLPN